MSGQMQTHKVQNGFKTRPCVSTFLSLCSYLYLNPRLHGPFLLPSLSPAACYSPSLSPFSVPVSRSATCHSVRPRGQASVSIYASDTKPVRQREKGLGPEQDREHAGASQIDKHQLAGNTSPSNPFKIFTSVPPATATQCREENRGTGENCGQLSKRK